MRGCGLTSLAPANTNATIKLREGAVAAPTAPWTPNQFQQRVQERLQGLFALHRNRQHYLCRHNHRNPRGLLRQPHQHRAYHTSLTNHQMIAGVLV